MRILLIEDDVMLGEALSTGLLKQTYVVDWVRDGIKGSEYWKSAPYDLVLLDLGLPRRDGLRLLTEARQEGRENPVIILTARDAVADRVKGLDCGADDYLLKPIQLDELLARIRATLRRHSGRSQPAIEHLGFRLDLSTRKGHYLGEEISFTRREFSVLQALLEHPGRVWTRERLVERIYSWNEGIASNVLEVQIHALRKKISSSFIDTVWGVGYVVPVKFRTPASKSTSRR